MAYNSIFIYKFNLLMISNYWYSDFNCKTGIKIYLWWIFIVKSNNKSIAYQTNRNSKITIQESSRMEKQYKAITEGNANGIAILSYSIKVKPEGFLQKT